MVTAVPKGVLRIVQIPHHVEVYSATRRSVDSLKEANLVLRLFDHLPAMVAFWDAEARNVVANEAYLEWFGWSPQKLRGAHISELMGPELYAKNLPYITGALAGQEQLFERTLVDTLGRTRHTQASYVPEIDDDGKVRGFFVLVTDVTPLAETRRELAEAEALTHVGSWWFRPSTGETSWSAEIRRILDVQEHETPGLELLFARVHPEDVTRVQQNIAAANATGGSYEHEYRIVRPDGETRHVLSRGSAVTETGTSTVVLLRGTLQDVTEEREARTHLEERTAFLGDMVGMLGHDLRNPTTAINGFLQLALETTTPDDPRSHYLDRALRAGRRLEALLGDVLAMARSEAGQLVAQTEVVAVRPLVEELLLSSHTEGVLNEISPGCRVCADPSQLRQILSNLVVNATRYGRPPITLRCAEADSMVEIAVHDEGGGVPEEFVPRLFGRFTRAEQLGGSPHAGTGLGLHIVDMLSRANGGSVGYRGPELGGPAFVVSLPRV